MRESGGKNPAMSDEDMRAFAMRSNLNTCHVWDEHGERVAAVGDGEPQEIPLWVRRSYERRGKLDMDPTTWRRI